MVQDEAQILLTEIEAFLAETGMGHTYFGKVAAGNSALVETLRAGGDCRTRTPPRVREFMRTRRHRLNNV
jgi:hypothetical protein